MPLNDRFLNHPSLTWLREEAACLPKGSVQRRLIEAQIARLLGGMTGGAEDPCSCQPASRSLSKTAEAVGSGDQTVFNR